MGLLRAVAALVDFAPCDPVVAVAGLTAGPNVDAGRIEAQTDRRQRDRVVRELIGFDLAQRIVLAVPDCGFGEEAGIEHGGRYDVGQTAVDGVVAAYAVAGRVDAGDVAERGGDAGEIEEGPCSDFAEVVEYGCSEDKLRVEPCLQGQVDGVDLGLEWEGRDRGVRTGEMV